MPFSRHLLVDSKDQAKNHNLGCDIGEVSLARRVQLTIDREKSSALAMLQLKTDSFCLPRHVFNNLLSKPLGIAINARLDRAQRIPGDGTGKLLPGSCGKAAGDLAGPLDDIGGVLD